jgi:hypothetical protein
LLRGEESHACRRTEDVFLGTDGGPGRDLLVAELHAAYRIGLARRYGVIAVVCREYLWLS